MQLKFSIKSSTRYLDFLRRLMSRAGRLVPGINFDHAVLMRCTLALVEAVNNAIFHAHREDTEEWINIIITFRDNAVEMQVYDNGPGFEMALVDEPPVDSINGRGLFLIRSMMDEVSYIRGKKNVLKMICYL